MFDSYRAGIFLYIYIFFSIAVVTAMKCGRGCQELTGRGGALSSSGRNDAVNTGKRRHLTGEKEISANVMTVGPR